LPTQYCTHKEETAIAVTISEIITAVEVITEVTISITDITKIMAITKIRVITETIIIRPTTIIDVVVAIEETTEVETPITTIIIQIQADKTIIMSNRYKPKSQTFAVTIIFV